MTLHVHEFGARDGQPLMMLHGAGGHGRRFRVLAERHLGRVRILAPDLRGHGASPWVPPWSLEQHAVDVLAAMDAAGWAEAPIVGHSLGAVVALYAARLAPERVSGLVLLDPGMAVPRPVAEERAAEALRMPSFGSPGEARAELSRSWPDRAAVDEVAEHLARGADGRWRWRYDPAMLAASYAEVARPAVTPPAGMRTVLVVARRSRAVPAGYAGACRAVLGPDRFEVVELDCGHLVYVERPAAVGRLVTAFLAGR